MLSPSAMAIHAIRTTNEASRRDFFLPIFSVKKMVGRPQNAPASSAVSSHSASCFVVLMWLSSLMSSPVSTVYIRELTIQVLLIRNWFQSNTSQPDSIWRTVSIAITHNLQLRSQIVVRCLSDTEFGEVKGNYEDPAMEECIQRNIISTSCLCYSHIKITKHQAEWLETWLLLGAIVGLPATIYFVEKIGRKRSLLLASSVLLVSWIVIAVADKIEYIYASRVASGMGGDMAFVAAPMYIAEISHQRVRVFFPA
ncbi:hypothetical protein NQ318_011363 [Aromia moschata]|uniref:Major facilitator superfamily (MFS) profile domain-containing protein n=1 Tax=Aromia moschata TaxID=1265417 RepID=A0AAV8YVH4_9CUCU|nr:hypothetical protein NQ318_011363 [Aromia moschata]